MFQNSNSESIVVDNEKSVPTANAAIHDVPRPIIIDKQIIENSSTMQVAFCEGNVVFKTEKPKI
jgi:hypothetical protein